PPTSDAEGFGFVGDRDLRPVEADPLGLVVDEREDRRRPPPHAFEVAQRVPRVVELEALALVAMPEQELAAVQVVRIDHVDERLPEVGQLPQQRVLDLLELARLDLEPPRPAILLEREKLLIATEVEREELVDERDVVVEATHLEDLLPPEVQLLVPVATLLEVVAALPLRTELTDVPAALDVAEQLHAELVRVQLPGRAGEHGRDHVGIVDDLRGLERPLR